MAVVVAQISDVHVGGPQPGSEERFAAALAEVEAMTRRPDLVLLTGDQTQDGTAAQWDEVRRHLRTLTVPWAAIAGNHDAGLAELAGHRTLDVGGLRFVLVDSSREVFTADDAAWLDAALAVAAHDGRRAVVAIHHPPFETGIWWMDSVGLAGAPLVEEVVRRHPHVIQVLSGHVHRPIASSWGSCALWVCPSTAVAIAPDLDPDHAPAESAEPPMFSLHAYTDAGVVSHVVPVGATARRSHLDDVAPEFVARARAIQRGRPSAMR